MITTLFLIRHFKPVVKPKSLLGHTDIDIEKPDHNQIAKIQDLSKQYDSFEVVSSDLKRAHSTAKLCFPECKIRKTDLLREINFGIYELYTWDEIEKQSPSFYSEYMKKWQTLPFPEGESTLQLIKRVEEEFSTTLNKSLPRGKKQAAFFFMHAGSLRASISHLCNISLNEAFSTKADYGDVIKLHFDPEKNSFKIQKK